MNRENCSITLSVTGTLPNSDWTLTIRGNRLILSSDTGTPVDTSNPLTIGTVQVHGTAPRALVVNANPATSFVERTRAVTVEEGASAAYTVKLASQPSAAVRLRLTRSGDLDLRRGTSGAWVTSLSLNFTTSNWNTAQTVGVQARQDADAADESGWYVRHQVNTTWSSTRDSNYDSASAVDLAVTVTDDDDAAIVLSPSTALAVTEGEEAAYTVRLSHVPTGRVRVRAQVDGATYGSLRMSGTSGGPYYSGVTYDYTASTWNTAQTVYVVGWEDDNSVDESLTIRHTVVDGQSVAEYRTVPDVNLTVNVTDNDPLTVSPQAVAVMEEGSGSSYTVALNRQPTGSVMVTATSQNTAVAVDTDGTPQTRTLTYSAMNWNTPQTVTVIAPNDANGVDETVTVRHAASSTDSFFNFAARTVDDVTMTVTDNDTPVASLALSASTIAESGSGNVTTVTAALDIPYGSALTVAVQNATDADVTVSSNKNLIIAAGDTTSTGTVTLTAKDNPTDAPNATLSVTAAIAGSVLAAPSSLTLTITDDDDPPDVTLALSDNSITENGGLSTVSATLSHPSSAVSTVTVTAVSGVFTVPSGAAGRIVLAAGDTTSTDTVTLTAANNDDVHSGNRMATVTATFANAQGTGAVTGVSLTVEEDETLPVATLALTPDSITEAGGVATVTATLSGKSSQAVTLTVSATAGTGATASDFTLSTTTTLTIAAGATTSTGTVTVTAVDNTAQSGSKQVTVSGTAAGGNSVANPADATLTLTDDDAATPTLALSSSSIAETGGVATVTATLDRQSSVAVTITVSATAVAPAVAGDLTLSSAPLLIFAANATTSTGTVTITAVNNTTDAPNKTVTVSGTASDSLGLANNPSPLSLTITDDDGAPTVTLAVAPTAVTENAGVSTVSATLSHPSGEATTVTVTAVAGDYSVGSDATIAIAAGMTANASDVATVTTVENDVHEGTGGRSTTVTATAANTHGVGAVTGAALTLTEDDVAPTVTLALSSTAVTEIGGVATVTATLGGKSSQAVTLTVGAAPGTGTAATDFSLSTAPTLTIAAGATTSTGTVTVTAVNNAVDHVTNRTVTVSATVAGGNGVSAPSTVTLTLTDDDRAGFAVSPATSTMSRLRTSEDGSTATFTVALKTEPTGNVVLDVTSSDAAQGTASPARLTFTAMTWATAQTVTLTGVDDDHPVNNPGGTTDGSQTYTVTVGSNVGMTQDATYNGLVGVTVYAINADDELGLDVGTVMGQATEAGGTATFTVALLTQPTAAVAVAVSSGDLSEGTASPSSLTFSTSNWGTAQTVTVTGVNDAVDDGTVAWAVRLDPSSPGSSGDSDYHALANVDVAVTTTDDDTAALVVAPTPSSTARLQTTEAGGTATFTVRLGSEPTGNVVLDVASTNTAEGTVSAAALTFTTGTWNAVQTVTLTGVNDAVDDGNQNYEATLTVNQTSTADSTYDALSVVTVYATNADDDVAGLAVSPSTSTTSRLRTREDGSQATFTVALNSEPTGNVVLDVASTDLAQGTVSPAALTFTTGTWNTAQTVTLTGVDDNPGLPDGSQDYTVTLTVNQTSTADSTYDGLTAVTVYAINADDELGLEVGPVSGAVTEASGPRRTATFTVALITAPTGPVQVAVSSLDPTEGTVAPATLTFTTTTWNVAQAVTVTGVDDDVDDGNVAWKVQLDPSSPGPGGDADYHALASEEVDVTTEDNDGLPTVRLALSSTAVTEAGGVATVTATLSGKSSEAVTVTVATTAVAPAGAADFARSPANTLTIAAGTTTSTGLVTVTARDNAIDAPADKQVTVSATATGGHGVENPPDVTLTLTDDDTAGLLLAPTALALEEQTADPQATATYTVRLATEPTGAVTVTVTKAAVENSNAAVVSVAPPTLTFTMADWATAQPVTVTTGAEAENDYRDDMVDLKHAVTVANSADSNYASLPPAAVRVTVTDKDMLPELRAGADTTVNGHPVRVTATRADETAAAVVVTPPADLNGALTVAIGPPTQPPGDAVTASDATEGTAVRRRFSLGTEAAARTVVDIEVTGPGRATVQTDGLTICLPVSAALRAEAGGRPLRLLHRPEGGEWTVVPPNRVEDQGERLCLTEYDFSEFAVAYQDAQPRFAANAQQLAPKTYLTGRAVNDELPGATGGDGGRTYTLTPALPAGLEHTQPAAGATHGGTITGTPTTPTAKQDYTLTVRDDDGDTDSITFSIEVKPGIESRDLGLVLAGIGRTLATDAVEILGGRFGSTPASRPQITLGGQVLRLTEPTAPPAPSPSNSPSPLEGEGRGEGALLRGEGAQGSGEWRVKSGGESGGPRVNPKAAGTSSWQQATGLALNVARALGINLDLPSSNSSPSSSNSPSPLAGEGRGEGTLLQGQGAFFQGDSTLPGRSPTALRRGGTTDNLLRLQSVSAKDLLARSAFELPLTRTGDDVVPAWTLWGRGSAAGFAGQPEDGFKMDGTLYSGYLGVDYRHASLLMGLAVAHSTGEVSYERTGATKAGADVKLTSVLPYVHWQPSAGLGVWSLLGAGWGEMDLKLAGDSQTRSTRLNSWLGAVGGRQALTTWQGIDLAAKTDAFLTTVRAAGTAEVPEAQGHAQRVRLLVEGRTAVAVSQVSRLEPRLELGARWDSGTAEQGLGAEVGGGVAYTLTDWGLSIDAQGRYLLLHEDGAFEDWGASVNVRLDPGAAGQGAYLTLTPVWGQASSGVDQLWSPATALSQASGSTRPATDWRPGSLAVDVGYGLALADGQFLTPYGGLALGPPGSSRYRLGSRLALSSALNVTLEGERAEQPGQAPGHGVSIRLGWQW